MKLWRNIKGVSSVITNVLLVGITVALILIFYTWVSGLLTTQMNQVENVTAPLFENATASLLG